MRPPWSARPRLDVPNPYFLYSCGTFGTCHGFMWGVHGFATDKDGNLYTAEVRTGRVQKYTPRKGANATFLVARPWPGVWWIAPVLHDRHRTWWGLMTVMVTGGSRGIGLAIAQELAKAGHRLLLVARNAGTLERAAHAIRETSAVEVQYLTCDLASLDDIEKLHTACAAAGFRPNVLVLNAGLFIEGSLMDSSDAAFADSLNVNLVSMYRVVKSFVRSLKAMKGSRIILIGSTGGFEAYPGGALCGVAKWGVRGFAVNLRQELMEAGVGVTLVAPGGTLTDAWAGEEIPEGRLLEPADIGKLVAATLTLSSQAVVEEIIVRPMLGDIRE